MPVRGANLERDQALNVPDIIELLGESVPKVENRSSDGECLFSVQWQVILGPYMATITGSKCSDDSWIYTYDLTISNVIYCSHSEDNPPKDIAVAVEHIESTLRRYLKGKSVVEHRFSPGA